MKVKIKPSLLDIHLAALTLCFGVVLGLSALPTPAKAQRVPASIKPPAICRIPRDCDLEHIPQSDPRRGRYDTYIVSAANRFGVPPALLKAQIHAETSLASPKIENRKERSRYKRYKQKLSPYMKAYRWGKGLGQFGANNAHLYGLAWFSKDIGKPVTIELFGIPNTINLRDVFDPKAAIEAKAIYFRELIDSNFMFRAKVPIRNRKGKVINYERRWVHAFSQLESPTEYTRLLVAAYNRGPNRIVEAAKSFYKRHKRLPRTYSELLEHTFLNRYRVTKCHVSKIVGICNEPTGYVSVYEQDFAYNPDKGLYEIP